MGSRDTGNWSDHMDKQHRELFFKDVHDPSSQPHSMLRGKTSYPFGPNAISKCVCARAHTMRDSDLNPGTLPLPSM